MTSGSGDADLGGQDLSAPLGRKDRRTSFAAKVDRICRPLAEAIAGWRREAARPIVVGICGPQGSGKSTVCAALAASFALRNLRTAVLGLDDLYLPKARRAALAVAIHPLLKTRGPPGTHDVGLGLTLLDDLTRTGPIRDVALPAFDKASDDRRPPDQWPHVVAPVDMVMFEGWCVGAGPQASAALGPPVNALEAEEDTTGRWRASVEAALAGPYQTLFGRLDRLILLKPPSFDEVFAWRSQQEAELALRLGAQTSTDRRAMAPDELRRFIMHYERLTRHILTEMPSRADLVVELGPDRAPLGFSTP